MIAMRLRDTKRARTGPALGKDDIAQLESKIGHRLPADYARFLRDNNPGLCDLMRCENPILRIRRWHPLSTNDKSETVITESINFISEHIPSGLIPIALDEGGYSILLDLRHASKGSIYWWNYQVSGIESLVKMFDSFSALMAALEWSDDRVVEFLDRVD